MSPIRDTDNGPKPTDTEEPINFRSSPNFKHMKKYLKFKFEEENQNATTDTVTSPPIINDNALKLNPTEVKAPLPLDLPPDLPPELPPDNPPHIKKEIEDTKHNVEYLKKHETDEPLTMCRNFARGQCNRLDCKYAHKFIPDQLTKVFIFCKDFENSKCSLATCKYLHASTFVKEHFSRTGYLPFHVINPVKNPLIRRQLMKLVKSFGQPTPNCDRPPPNVNSPLPNVNRPLPNVNRPLPNVNRPPPNVNRPPQNVNRPPPNVNRPPPNFNRPPPNFNRPPPLIIYDKPPPSIPHRSAPVYFSPLPPPPPPPPLLPPPPPAFVKWPPPPAFAKWPPPPAFAKWPPAPPPPPRMPTPVISVAPTATNARTATFTGPAAPNISPLKRERDDNSSAINGRVIPDNVRGEPLEKKNCKCDDKDISMPYIKDDFEKLECDCEEMKKKINAIIEKNSRMRSVFELLTSNQN